MKNITLTQLKKKFLSKSKQDLVDEIGILFKTYPQVKEYYQIQEGGISKVFDKYQDIIEKEFVDGKTKRFPKARLSVAKKTLSDFKKICTDPKTQISMMLVYARSLSQFCNEFSPDREDYYTSPENMFEKAMKMIKKHGYEKDFKKTAQEIVDQATDGWGHSDSLNDSFFEVYDNND